MVQEAPPLLELQEIEKRFPNGTVALKGITLDVRQGSIHGLLGANGAGKSTLIRILSGDMRASAGSMRWQGRPFESRSPLHASQIGIATIYQHIPLVPTLSIIENVFLVDRGFWRKNRSIEARFNELCEQIGYYLPPDEIVGDLPIGKRQMVAIAKALGVGASLIVMDEPTASLANEEREVVYAVIRTLAAQGKSVLFVSHFLDEIVSLTDAVTVIRDGRAVMRALTKETSEHAIAEAIIGRSAATLEHLRGVQTTIRSDVALRVVGIASKKIAPTTFEVRAGEILGIAGFLGSGRSELLHAIFGADNRATGDTYVAGKKIARSPGAAVDANVGLVPEDRMSQALIPEFAISKNISLPHIKGVSTAGLFPSSRAESERAERAIKMLNIKTQSAETVVTALSGGNAQKVTIAKWLFGHLKVLLLDEPTAGVDIGAKADILRLVRRLADEGLAVVLATSDFDEMLKIADRVLVLREGKVIAERAAFETTEHELVLLSGGSINNQAAEAAGIAGENKRRA